MRYRGLTKHGLANPDKEPTSEQSSLIRGSRLTGRAA